MAGQWKILIISSDNCPDWCTGLKLDKRLLLLLTKLCCATEVVKLEYELPQIPVDN